LLIAGEIAFVALAFSQSQVIDDTLSSSWEKMSDTDKTIVQNSVNFICFFSFSSLFLYQFFFL